MLSDALIQNADHNYDHHY